MSYPVISADSHITEHPDTYTAHIDRAFRDRAPRIVSTADRGDVFVIDGMDRPIALGLVAAAGKKPEEITEAGVKFEDLHRGGWDPVARLADQDRDGVAAEVIYPTVGMMLCNHPDFDYKKACFDAYNRWIAEYCASQPDRLLGCGQTTMRTPAEGVEEIKSIKALGLRGVMMTGRPGAGRLRQPDLRPVLGDRRRPGLAAVVSHPDEPRYQQASRPAHQQLHVDHPRQPGHSRHA